MGELRKVYLPPWMTWFGLVLLLPMWLWITYQTFFTGGGAEDVGVGGWLAVTVVMVVVGAVMYLMGRRKLPAYLIEMEEGDDGPEA